MATPLLTPLAALRLLLDTDSTVAIVGGTSYELDDVAPGGFSYDNPNIIATMADGGLWSVSGEAGDAITADSTWVSIDG